MVAPTFFSGRGGVFCRERIWNNYIEIQWKSMQVIFIILLCTWGYNSPGDPTRQHKVWRKILLQAGLGNEHKTKLNYSTYQTKFDTKITKMKWNYTANMIMSVSGIVCHLILYVPVNQGWQSICHGQLSKINNACALKFLTSSVDQYGFKRIFPSH